MTPNERRLLHEAGACWTECADCKESERPRGKCPGCGGPYPFEMSIPSTLWNQVVRPAGLPDDLCPTCIVQVFTRAGVSFSANLSGHGVWDAAIVVNVLTPGVDTLKDRKRSRDGWGTKR